MPGKNGYEVAQYIRRSTRLAHIPVVLLTGAFEPVDQARADEAGCDGVLAKPFEPQMVIGRVKELLARARRTPDLPAPASPLAERPAPSVAEPNSDPAPPIEISDYFDRLDAAFSTPAPNEPPVTPKPRAEAEPPPTGLENDLDWFGSRAEETGAATPWDLPAPPADVSVDLPLSYESPSPQAPLAPPAEPETFAAVAAAEPMIATAPVAGVAPIAPPDERLAPIEESAPVEESPPIESAAAVAESVAPVEHETHERERTKPAAAAPPALELPLPNPPPLPTLPDAFAALLAAEQSGTLPPDAGFWPVATTLQAPPPAALSEELIEDVTRRVLERLSETVVRDAVAGIASTIAERLIREEIERIKAAIK